MYTVTTGDYTEACGGLGRSAVQYATQRQSVEWRRGSAVPVIHVVGAARSIIRLHDLHQPAARSGLYLRYWPVGRDMDSSLSGLHFLIQTPITACQSTRPTADVFVPAAPSDSR